MCRVCRGWDGGKYRLDMRREGDKLILKSLCEEKGIA